MTNETTPDAVERQYQDSDGNPCDLVTLCRREPGWAANRIDTLLAERARHAEEVARLEAAHLSDLETIEAWKLASGLECGGDPDGVTPAGMRRYWEGVEADRDSLRDQLHQATELVSVLEERLDAFEDTEPDARACAEWVIDITQYGDTRQAARRYLSGVANRTATRLHRDVETLRDQLRRTEGERDAERKHATEMEERALDLVRDLRLAQVELHALRSLLPDVRACAEYIVERGVDNADGSARRILASLASQGGEGECLDRSDTRGVALERDTEALARAWEEGAEAAFDAQAPSEDSDYLNPLYGRALDAFYASNPYRTKGVGDE